MSHQYTTRQCLFCGNPFVLTKKHPHNVYCSRACILRKNAIEQRLPPFTCNQCGKTFTSTNGSAKYCSRQCAGKASNINRKRITPSERFWSNVQKTDGCWVWTGCRSHDYGLMGANKARILAHRFSWELHYGPIPNGLGVLHRCDNPPCVRPDHLFLGTFEDNMKDKIAKGRQARGWRKHKDTHGTSSSETNAGR